jgi:hypothetical protein
MDFGSDEQWQGEEADSLRDETGRVFADIGYSMQ